MQRSQPDVRVAAGGYWRRRGLPTAPEQVVAAPSARLLLLAVLGAVGGGVLLPGPGADWHRAPVGLLGRPGHRVPVPAESGGAPDAFALQEMVRRIRREGGEPRVLLLSVADDPTGTVPPPELLHEVCEVAAAERLLVVSDETWRDTFHHPHETVLVSPAEILPETVGAVVLCDLHPNASALRAARSSLSAAPGPGSTAQAVAPAGTAGPGVEWSPPTGAVARFPADAWGRELAGRVGGLLDALDGRLGDPDARRVAEVLEEPSELRSARGEQAREHGRCAAALYRTVMAAGGLCRPPRVGRQLYIDLEPLRPALSTQGVHDAVSLEAALVRRLGPCARGGHHFGDDPGQLRARLTTEPLVPPAPGHPGPTTGEGTSGSLEGMMRSLRAVLGASRDEGGPP